MKRLDDLAIPHFLFVNKIDKASGSLRALLSMLQEASDKPLLLRQIPIWKDEKVSESQLVAKSGVDGRWVICRNKK